MKKVLFFAAVALLAASCTDDKFVGDVTTPQDNSPSDSVAIVFSSASKGITRADIAGDAAATLLGNNFYVIGTKGTEPETSPTTNIVFDNYLVHYTKNTAGVTESNTANWEYVGVTPGSGGYADYDRLSSLNTQTIKYWDYSTSQYDFLAFSTGTFKAKKNKDNPADNEIGVTASKYGSDLASSGTAYTFYLPSVEAIKNAYISDITEVAKSNYGKEVTLKFKNLGSKVRIALYETVPGYSVKDVVFYKVDGTNTFTDGDADDTNDNAFKSTTAALISANATGIPTSGTIAVYFPHVGTQYQPGATNAKEDYDKAAATVTAGSTSEKSPTFGSLNYTGKDPNGYEFSDNIYLGRSLPAATFAGVSAASYYQTVFPVSTSDPLTLRVDYTLVATDGSGENIKIYGAKAVVPSNYTKWLPNYAYTYIFKISDNTNGWTDPSGAEPAGLFPITFDAVVTEVTDANAEQTTITTVATPTITTYQQNHDITNDEYSKATAKNIYVQVMDNSAVPATLKGDLNGNAEGGATKKSLLYAVTGTTPASEALVMDALENQSSADAGGVITGRNGVVLTPATIDAAVTSIENGVDDNPITVSAGQAAMISYNLSTGTYAYVYDYSDNAKVLTTIYQPIAATGTLGSGVKYVTTTILDAIDTGVADNVTTENENVNSNAFLYFSKTKNGTGDTTYSFVSVDGKKTLPAGLVKCPVNSLSTSGGNVEASSVLYAFTVYTRNTGKYAVKIIKIVA